MDSFPQDELFMRRCLELARKAKGKTGMNPMVGCVIVKDGRIIGEGYHKQFGGPHAEVEAINSVGDKKQLKHSTLYVNLEPCSHFGKTPPCSLLIREHRIPSVVIGCEDPNPMVSGKGIQQLREAGIHVKTKVLEKESVHLNRRFFTHIIRKRPYVILKWAQSNDGYIDILRKPGAPAQPTWITNHTARKLVHKWRGEEDGIFAGVNTIMSDDPGLDLREWSGKQPIRITIDRKNRIKETLKFKNGLQETIIFTEYPDKGNTAFYQKIESDFNLEIMLNTLLQKEISSIIVEGGRKILNSFINNNIWDEARVFSGNMNFHSGVAAPTLPIASAEEFSYRNHKLSIYFNQNIQL